MYASVTLVTSGEERRRHERRPGDEEDDEGDGDRNARPPLPVLARRQVRRVVARPPRVRPAGAPAQTVARDGVSLRAMARVTGATSSHAGRQPAERPATPGGGGWRVVAPPCNGATPWRGRDYQYEVTLQVTALQAGLEDGGGGGAGDGEAWREEDERHRRGLRWETAMREKVPVRCGSPRVTPTPPFLSTDLARAVVGPELRWRRAGVAWALRDTGRKACRAPPAPERRARSTAP